MSETWESPQGERPDRTDPGDPEWRGDDQLDPGDTLTTDRLDADPLDTGFIPADRPTAVDRYGVTLAEQRLGESLDQHLAQEEPDPAQEDTASYGRDGDSPRTATAYRSQGPREDGIPASALRRDGDRPPDEWPDGPDPRSGRLTSADEGCHDVTDAAVFAFDHGIDGGAASAEEAAVHVIQDEDEVADFRDPDKPGPETPQGPDDPEVIDRPWETED